MPATGQAPAHLLVHLATIGLTCHATGDRFALLDDWLPTAAAGPRGDEALAELARRWFRAYSPATGADFTTWSGLPATRAIELIRDELTPVDLGGRKGFRLGPTVEAGAAVRLLGAFDNYLIGYRERAAMIAADRRAEVYVGGIIRPTVLYDGRVIGRWWLNRAGSRAAAHPLVVRLFEPAPPGVEKGIEAEVTDIGRFLGRSVAPADGFPGQ